MSDVDLRSGRLRQERRALGCWSGRSGHLSAFLSAAIALLALAGCGPDYSPDTYASRAAQQANKVEQGVIVGLRQVAISADGTTGAVAGSAAGGAAGSTVGGGGVSSTFGAIGGALVGGLVGTAAEHAAGDTQATEYVVRKTNGEMVSVTQKDPKPLKLGQKVLVIAGVQARIVADYTVPVPPQPDAQPAVTSAPAPVVPLPDPPSPEIVIPPVIPGAHSSPLSGMRHMLGLPEG